MFGAIWRVLPGPWWLRLFIALALIAAVLYGLFFYVFPWASPIFLPGEVDVE